MKIKKLFTKLTDSNNRVKIIAFMGFAAILMIFLSELLPKKSSDTANEPIDEPKIASSDYAQRAEKRLEELLSEIKGVGKAELILSVEGSEEYIYAEETETALEQKDNDKEKSEKYKNKLFVSETSGKKDALVKKVINPRFNGALVICDGGGDAAVRERVIKAVSAALDLPASKICVECRKN